MVETIKAKVTVEEQVKAKVSNEDNVKGSIGEVSAFDQMLYNKTKVVDREFKEFEYDKLFKVGDKITLDNVQDKTQDSCEYYFYTTDETGNMYLYYNHESGLLHFRTYDEVGNPMNDGMVKEYEFKDHDYIMQDYSADYEGEGLLGTWTEKPSSVTIQDIYDNTKVVEKEFKEFAMGPNNVYKAGTKITVDNVQYKYIHSLGYSFTGVETDFSARIHYDNANECLVVDINGEEIEYFEYTLPVDCIIEEKSNEYNGTGLLGEWTEKQLTAQKVYDNQIGYKTAKVVVDQYDLNKYRLILPTIDIINGDLTIKMNNGDIFYVGKRYDYQDDKMVWYCGSDTNHFQNMTIYSAIFGGDKGTINEIVFDTTEEYSEITFEFGEEVEIMYFSSPFVRYIEI